MKQQFVGNAHALLMKQTDRTTPEGGVGQLQQQRPMTQSRGDSPQRAFLVLARGRTNTGAKQLYRFVGFHSVHRDRLGLCLYGEVQVSSGEEKRASPRDPHKGAELLLKPNVVQYQQATACAQLLSNCLDQPLVVIKSLGLAD